MTTTENTHNVATARGYTIGCMEYRRDGIFAVATRTTLKSAPDHLAHVVFRFNKDGTFHSCNYFRSYDDASCAYWGIAA